MKVTKLCPSVAVWPADYSALHENNFRLKTTPMQREKIMQGLNFGFLRVFCALEDRSTLLPIKTVFFSGDDCIINYAV